MARKLYFGSAAAPVNPAYYGSWSSGPYNRFILGRSGTDSGGSFADSTTTSGDYGLLQFVSEPLAPQTISGTVVAWMLTSQSNAAADMRSQMVVRVVSGDGSTYRGTLLDFDNGSLSNEWFVGDGTNLRARAFPRGATSGAPLNSVNALLGDRLVVEVGFRRHAAGPSQRFGYVHRGSGSDISANESATAGRAWIEFSQDIVFQDELNTPPEITVNPSVNYNGFTRTGPNNSPVAVEFEAEDAEETGTDELTVEVRTAASGGGTLVATDDYTSGTSGSISIAHNASGLSEGSNTLYMRVGDGTDWSDDESFTLLVDRGAPTVGTITQTPNPAVP